MAEKSSTEEAGAIDASETVGVGSGGGKSSTTGTPRGRRSSTLPIRGGTREVKAYAVTEDELSTLGALQGLAALFFTLGGTSFGFWFSVKLQIAFASAQTDPQTMGYWKGIKSATLSVTVLMVALGLLIFFFNGWRVYKIRKGTSH